MLGNVHLPGTPDLLMPGQTLFVRLVPQYLVFER